MQSLMLDGLKMDKKHLQFLPQINNNPRYQTNNNPRYQTVNTSRNHLHD